MSIVFLAGCDGSESWCFVTPPDAYTKTFSVKSTNNSVVQVSATGSNPNDVSASLGSWISSGVAVREGDSVALSASGAIILATPFGLSSSTTSGNAVSSQFDNPQYASQTAAYRAMIAGQNYTGYYDNGGLGTKFVIQANATSPTVVTIPGTTSPYIFLPTQNVTVTTANCATGDVSSSSPTKWTWNNNWLSYTVRCHKRGTRNFTVSAGPPVHCKAVKKCGQSSPGIASFNAWDCNLQYQINANYSNTQDICSTYGTNPSYNCQYNASLSGACYTSDPNWYRPGNSGFCAGSHQASGVTVSDTSPSCGLDDDNQNVTTPSVNGCGTVDSCWNIGGYRLYAIQPNVTRGCPTDSNCVHLNNSTVTEGGKSFNAYGGAMSLKIYDPNAAAVIDQNTLNNYIATLNANASTIASLSSQNMTYSNYLVNQLGAVNNIAGFDCSQISSLQSMASTYTTQVNTTDIINNGTTVYNQLTNISNNLSTLSSQCNNLTSAFTTFANGSTPYSTNASTITNYLSNISSTLSSLTTLINNLGNPTLSSTSTLSSQDLASFQVLLSSIIGQMTNESVVSYYNGNTLPGIGAVGASLIATGNTLDPTVQGQISNILTSIASLQKFINNGDTNLSNYANDSYNKQIAISYVDPLSEVYYNSNGTLFNCANNPSTCNNDPSSVSGLIPSTPSWYNNLYNGTSYGNNPNIQSLVSSLSSLVNALPTTPSNVANFRASLNTMLSNVNSTISSSLSTYNTINTNQNTIDSLGVQNVNLSTAIAQANNVGSSGAVGGYTVFIKADPMIASNGQYLTAVVTSGDPNVAGTGMTDLGVITADPKNNTQTMTATGTIWLKIVDLVDGNYANNVGQYDVTIGQIQEVSSLGALFSGIVNRITNGIGATSVKIFQNIGCFKSDVITGTCWDYLRSLRIILNLYVIVFGMMFLFGLIETNYVDFLIRIIKIAIVIVLMSPTGYSLTYQYFFQGMLKLSKFLIAMATGAPASNPFAFLDQSIAIMFFDQNTYIKILSLVFIGGLGIIVLLLMLSAAISFIKATFEALKVYVMSLVGIALCIAVTPIFLIFMLFQPTQHLFSNWFKAIVRFVLEPVILIIGLMLLNAMLIIILQQLFNFSACFKCSIPFTFNIPGLFNMGSLFCLPWFGPWGVDNLGGGMAISVLLSIPLLISFVIVAKLMEMYAETMSKQITTGILGEGLRLGSKTPAGAKKLELGINPFSRQQEHYQEAKYRAQQVKDFAQSTAKRLGIDKYFQNKQSNNLAGSNKSANNPGSNNVPSSPRTNPANRP